MNININFKELIRQYIAPHRRQTNRLNWLWALIDLSSVWQSWVEWRDYYKYKIHVTSQQAALLGHLINCFGSGILIKSYDDNFLEVGLNDEEAHWVWFDPYQEVALEGESTTTFEDVDFIVYAPSTVDLDLLSAEIEKYKLADKAYKIIVQ
ncbi:MAG: hypothetical protein SNJ29_07260 [Rikenellaceae bacterium]